MRCDCSMSRFEEAARPLSGLAPGTRGTVVRVASQAAGGADRLAALGVTPGAAIVVLQRFPGIVFGCDQTELAVERSVARGIYVHVEHAPIQEPGDRETG